MPLEISMPDSSTLMLAAACPMTLEMMEFAVFRAAWTVPAVAGESNGALRLPSPLLFSILYSPTSAEEIPAQFII